MGEIWSHYSTLIVVNLFWFDTWILFQHHSKYTEMHVLWCRLCQMHYCHLLSLSLVINIVRGSNLKKFQLIHFVNAKNCKPGLMIKLRLTHPCHFCVVSLAKRCRSKGKHRSNDDWQATMYLEAWHRLKGDVKIYLMIWDYCLLNLGFILSYSGHYYTMLQTLPPDVPSHYGENIGID